jgi:hypothetical protein
MRNLDIILEMARRKVKFHPDEDWDKIQLWGLFRWYEVSRLIRSGKLRTSMKKENRTIWVMPSKKFWDEDIEPVVNLINDLNRDKGR